ncbi:unnamed protein product [Dovyalis caffra]|uniref:Uncharacterized protein n=1 Tax=Dovyalis caffra TaxID=77055 RepID=A0AAV1RPY1_9ROSI|nr:unnamed protein product [Dovyalis caffra]
MFTDRRIAGKLTLSNNCKSLTHFFFTQHGTTIISRTTDLGLGPKRGKKVALLGRGFMGSRVANKQHKNDEQSFMEFYAQSQCDDGGLIAIQQELHLDEDGLNGLD